ncbi:MAG: aldehyde dehydrogenase family protein [Pseudomonadota bacterium]
MSSLLERREFYIDGKWIAPSTSRDHAVVDPSTEETCAVISLGTQADTDAAVAAARGAFPDWSQTAKAQRVELLKAILEIYKRRAPEMDEAHRIEMGAPIDFSKAEQTPSGSSALRAFIRALDQIDFARPMTSHASEHNWIFQEPVGVCGLITPWNWPMNQVTLKVGAALAAGCTMVLKPSEVAPLSSMLFAEVLDEAGVPAGVFNLVNGDGAGVGTQLSEHADVDMISFTGSTRAGRAITIAAAGTLKRVALELGGKGANIVFADADADAVPRGATHCFENTGQSCNAPTRMLVERARYDQAIEEARATAEATRVGPSHEPGAHIGPLVSREQYEKVQRLIEVGIVEGARLVAGGPGRPDSTNRGYFARPTVFADVTNDMTIAREEIFGPVLSILPFDTEDEAVAIANDTPYGLTNYVQTQDPARANRMARRLRSGMVRINGASARNGSPFGGVKQSGNGREGGIWGLEEFLEVKHVTGWTDGA